MLVPLESWPWFWLLCQFPRLFFHPKIHTSHSRCWIHISVGVSSLAPICIVFPLVRLTQHKQQLCFPQLIIIAVSPAHLHHQNFADTDVAYILGSRSDSSLRQQIIFTSSCGYLCHSNMLWTFCEQGVTPKDKKSGGNIEEWKIKVSWAVRVKYKRREAESFLSKESEIKGVEAPCCVDNCPLHLVCTKLLGKRFSKLILLKIWRGWFWCRVGTRPI